MLSTMRLTDAALESIWNKLTYKTLRAPRDVVRAFAALGGAEAEAVYCTMYSDENRTSWFVLAVNGELLIYVSARGQRSWHQDDDGQRDALEAFTVPIRSYLFAIRIDDKPSPGRGFIEDENEASLFPRPATWVLTRPHASSPGIDWFPLPHWHDQDDASQHQKAEFVADTIRLRLMGSNVVYGSSL
jgi:hypothetical protein